MTERAEVSGADYAKARAWADEVSGCMLSFEVDALADRFSEVRAEGYAAGVAAARDACREVCMEAARLYADGGDEKEAAALQVVALAVITNGVVRDRTRAGAPSPQVEGNAQLGGTGASGGGA